WFGSGAQFGNLSVDFFAVGGIGAANQTSTKVTCPTFQRSGLVVQVFSALPVRLCGSFGLFALCFEIHLPGEFVFHSVGEVVGLIAPPFLLGLEFFQPDGLGFGIAFVTRWVRVLVEPDGVGVEVFGAII